MAFIRKKLGMGKKKHSHGDEQVFYDAHGVPGCPGCAALKQQNDELKAELASLRKVIKKPPDSVTCFR